MNNKKYLIASFLASALMLVLPASALELGWTGGPMSASGDTIRTDGDVVWAYCGGQTDLETFTVNGITFTAVKKTDSIPQSLKPFPFDTSPRMFMDKTGYGTEGVSDADYGHILDTGWWYNASGENNFTLTGLEANHIYLVQMVFRYPHINAIYKVVAPDGTEVRAGSGDQTPDKEMWKYGGTLVNVFQASSETYTFKLNYNQDRSYLSAIQLRDVSDEPIVIKPVIGSATAKPHVGKVTISLAGVLKGSDDKGAAASSYSVICVLDGGDPETVLEGQTEAKIKFDLENLEDGEHTIEVSILNDKGVASDAVSLTFNTEIPLGWTAEPMDADGDAISLDGDLIFAYSSQKDVEVKGIAFTGKSDFRASNAFGSSDGFYRDMTEHAVSPPVADSDYGTLLAWSFWTQSGARTVTLYNLEPGEKYLVQLICCNSTKSGKFFAPEGEETYVKPCGDGWTYGGTLVGVFVASAAEMTFALNMDGQSAVNAIQLRKFKAPPKAVDPAVGSLTAKAKGTTATVTLADVNKGTDDKGIPATSYSVSYKLDGGDEVLALEDQTGATASFTIEDLTDGEYTCSVTITTSAGKTTEGKSVTFLVNTSIGDFDALKEAIESAAMGDTITVARGTYYATSKIEIRQKNVTIVATDNVVINGEDSTEGAFEVKAEGATISGIEFENCSSAGYGGAINVNNNYHGFVATNCIFRNCAAKMGGGIGGSCYYGSHGAEASDGIPARGELGVITGCKFINCASTGTSAGDGESGGGAVEGAYWIENTTFEGGSSNYYTPGIHSGFNLMVTNCTFKSVEGPGKSSRGLVWMSRGNTELCVVDCTFVDMTCQPLVGAASGKLLVDRCVFKNCAGTETKPNDNSGEMQLVYGSGTVRNSLICGNMNPFALGNQVFENCTIADNVGGFFIKINSGAAPAFTNCAWARNTKWAGEGYTSWGGPGLSWHGGDSSAYTKTTFSHCALEGAAAIENQKVLFGQDPTGTTKTLSEALDEKGPKFMDPENGDYTLKSGSPLKDVGVLCDWMVGARDLAGNPRVKGQTVDLGCYECKPTGMLVILR